MPDLVCPSCGHRTEGPFCSQCGARVVPATECASCGSPIPSGGRFCNQCGTPVAAAGASASKGPARAAAAGAATTPAAKASSTLPWVVTGFAVLALVIALVFPRPDGESVPPPAGAAAPASAAGSEFGDARSVDLASMTPRQRADALFNRVMENVSAGDSTQAKFFLPMALAAYDEVPGLDADGHYHVAVLHLSGGDAAAARQRADSILATAPQHLFGLFTAAQAEQAMGNTEAARELYARFNASFEAEMAAGRTEYGEHQGVIPMMQEEARKATGG